MACGAQATRALPSQQVGQMACFVATRLQSLSGMMIHPSKIAERHLATLIYIYILYLDSWHVSYVKSCPKSESISTIFYHFLPELYPFLLFIPHSCWAEPSSCTTSASVECPLWSLRPLVAARPLAVAPFLGSVKTLELPGLFLLFVFSLVYELTLFFGIVLFGFALVMQIRVPIRI